MKSFKKYIIALVVGAIFLLLPNSVGAIDTKGLTLSPLRSDLNITPGTSLDSTITVVNSTDKPMSVQLSAEEFSVTNEQYDYAFTPESDVAKWVAFEPTEVDLLPGENKPIKFRVGVPLTAEPGGRYISLFATTDASATGGGANSRQRVASLLYITVLGTVTRNGNLLSLTSPWAISGDSTWTMSLQNTGTTHFRSRYTVQVQKLLGDSVVASLSDEVLILPGTVRSISDQIPLPQLPGIYKVVYNIGLGDKPAVTETRWFIYMPIWAGISLVAIIILTTLWLLRKKILNKH